MFRITSPHGERTLTKDLGLRISNIEPLLKESVRDVHEESWTIQTIHSDQNSLFRFIEGDDDIGGSRRLRVYRFTTPNLIGQESDHPHVLIGRSLPLGDR